MNKKLHYTTAEACHAAGCCLPTLRKYEGQGLIRPARFGNGYRLYTPEDIEIVKRTMAENIAKRGRHER